MTLTIKDTTDAGGSGKPGLPAQTADAKHAPSTRANPRCLEVPVTVRSLPGENGDARGSGPIREEGRTVIVFDNGAVLRLWNNLPSGQKIILSNAQGDDVVCRVVSGRNLPTVQGYIEVDFMEPFNDFWRIQQNGKTGNAPGNAPPSPTAAEIMGMTQGAPAQATPVAPTHAAPHGVSRTSPSAVPPIPPPVAPPAAPSAHAPVTPMVAAPVSSTIPAPAAPAPAPATIPGAFAPAARVPAAETETKKGSQSHHSGGAPTFDDVAGLLRMSPPPAGNRAQANEQLPLDAVRNRSALAGASFEAAAKASAANDTPVAVADVVPMKRTIAAPELSSSHLPAPSFGGLESRSLLGSAHAPAAAATSPSASRSSIGLIVGGIALLFAGFGAGYLFLHRPQAAAPVAAVAAAQPAIATPAAPQTDAVQPALPAPAPPERAAAEREAASASHEKEAAAAEQRAAANDAAKEQQVELTAKQKQAQEITNFKMSSPSAPKQDLTKFSSGSAPDVSALAPVSGAPSMNALSGVVRPENQPAPPPAPAPKIVTIAKLLSSTKPVYPPEIRDMSVQGVVAVVANVDANGNVSNTKALSGPVPLRAAAAESVKHWKYSPALIDGKPVVSQVTVNVQFNLN